MSKYIVETFYTCTFKIVHKLDKLNEKKLSELENRNDGEVEIIDVKLNNRKTKTTNKKENLKETIKNLNEKSIPDISSIVNEKIVSSWELQGPSKLDSSNIKTNKLHNKKTNDRSKMPDRRKGYTHTSVAILDALLAIKLPAIEVHITNIYNREEFRKKSLISKAAKGIICGFGVKGYIMALDSMKEILN